jgi:hypothetical protein
MNVFPNPIRDNSATVSYQLAKDGQVSIKVIDLLGRNIQNINLGNQMHGSHTYLLHRTNKLNGNYFIVLYQDNAVIGRNKVIILNR